MKNEVTMAISPLSVFIWWSWRLQFSLSGSKFYTLTATITHCPSELLDDVYTLKYRKWNRWSRKSDQSSPFRTVSSCAAPMNQYNRFKLILITLTLQHTPVGRNRAILPITAPKIIENAGERIVDRLGGWSTRVSWCIQKSPAHQGDSLLSL